MLRNKGSLELQMLEAALACLQRGHEMLEFGIQRRGSRAKSKFTTLKFREQICLGEAHGIRLWREEGPKNVVSYSKLTCKFCQDDWALQHVSLRK